MYCRATSNWLIFFLSFVLYCLQYILMGVPKDSVLIF